MTVVAANLYRNGKRIRQVSLDEACDFEPDESGFVWIGLCDTTDEEMDTLRSRYALHPLAIEDSIKSDQLPKLDVYDDQLFALARTASLDGDEIVYGATAVFVGKRHVVSVRNGSDRSHTALRDRVESAPALLAKGTGYVLHAILDFIVDGYLPIVDEIEDRVLAMEKRSHDVFLERGDVALIFKLRRELMRFQRVLGPMGDVAGKLVRLDLPCVDGDMRPYFSDVLDHVRRVHVMVDGLLQVLSSVFEFSTLLEQQRTGVITRQLAAWAAILAVPTAIAGIYGMNFQNMPELRTRYGYFVVLAVIAAVCAFLYVRFKRLKWL
ncbi:magnesium and cobalt transport protein CorA [Sphingomonas sp. BK580]|uniref:magnesium and cobalt transport protein CorA n=1 Tax=Sphingomonas sp. BK580 TaxID=2586972 RepID=UPI00161D12D2|nr:magnesium and cobalt transport protein CorA [Sphingomonas sp. BK580]MBB3693606.1 magnesium transporter [Sphingomonas sp. BK580]